MTDPTPLDPALFARVRALHLAARALVAGLHAGPHLAVQRGHEAEFVGYQPYVPPHPLKDVDWRAYARNDRMVVRERRAERELSCMLVFDASADLGSTPAKWQQAVQVTAALACAVLANGDPVGLRIGAGEGVAEPRIPPSRSRSQLARIVGALAAARPGGRADLASLLSEVARPRLAGGVASRSLVGIVSDFMEDPGAWQGAIGALAARGVDVRAVQIYDRGELTLAGAEPARLRSPETGRRFPVDPGAVRGAFADVVAAWLAEVHGAFTRNRALVLPLAAEDPPVPVVASFLAGAAASVRSAP